jgi:hypothetical protein
MSKFGAVFVLVLVVATLFAVIRPPPDRLAQPMAASVAANQRLTSLVGGPLFILLVAIAVTVLFLQWLLPEHYLVGFLLIPPLLLKLASTGYRFVRYYTHDPRYRKAGPPPVLLRLVVAPVLVVSTIVVFATGVELWLVGLRFGSVWISAHTVSAVFFVLAAALHSASHLRVSAEAGIQEVAAPAVDDALTRRSLVIASLVLGGVLAAASLLYMAPFPTGSGGG